MSDFLTFLFIFLSVVFLSFGIFFLIPFVPAGYYRYLISTFLFGSGYLLSYALSSRS